MEIHLKQDKIALNINSKQHHRNFPDHPSLWRRVEK